MPNHDVLAPLRARSPHLARLVLLAALAAGLGGLALPSHSSAATPVALLAAESLELHPAVAFAPTRLTTPVRRAPRATRSRHASTSWARPVPGGINSAYGPRWGRWHPGVDFTARTGTPIHVVADGTVIGAGYLSGESGYGQIVLVRHKGGVVTAYAHMSRVLTHAGARVHRGDVLGRVGSTGHVTGPHLHFEVRIGGAKVNPVPWLRRHGVRV